MAGTLEYEQLNKNLEMVDGHAVKARRIIRIRKNSTRRWWHGSGIPSVCGYLPDREGYRIGRKHIKTGTQVGEPYIIHPLWVGIILADLEMDKETIVAGMLHDAEDTEDAGGYHPGVRRRGGSPVDGVTKLGQLSYSQDKLEVQAENLRKMFLAMAKDIRVIIIKLATVSTICGRWSL